jgi:hypothetical protein
LAATSYPPPSNGRRGEPQDGVPVALAGPAHGPDAVTAASAWINHWRRSRCMGHRATPLGNVEATAPYTASQRRPRASTNFCDGIALADGVVAPIDPCALSLSGTVARGLCLRRQLRIGGDIAGIPVVLDETYLAVAPLEPHCIARLRISAVSNTATTSRPSSQAGTRDTPSILADSVKNKRGARQSATPRF